jgi:hypothetical protein
VPLHISSITCPSSGGSAQTALGILRACYVAQTALGILRACYVSWLHQYWSGAPTDKHARSTPSAVCEAPPEDGQVMLETC